jgi:hypothetical protein
MLRLFEHEPIIEHPCGSRRNKSAVATPARPWRNLAADLAVFRQVLALVGLFFLA